MADKKARAKALKLEAAKSEPPVVYKVRLESDMKEKGKSYDWTSLAFISADASLDAMGNHSPKNPKRTVGTITSRLVCRNSIRKTFWDSMQEPSQKTSALALAIFDRSVYSLSLLEACSALLRLIEAYCIHRYGCLREEFLDGPGSGSGVWKREFNDKCFQVVQSMSVDGGSSSYEVAREMM
jgi:hypothetical protein